MKSITTSFLGIAAALLASSAPSSAQIWQQDPAFAPVIVRETDATTALSAHAATDGRFWIYGGGWSPFTHVNGDQVWGLSRLLANGSIDASLPPEQVSALLQDALTAQWKRHG